MLVHQLRTLGSMVALEAAHRIEAAEKARREMARAYEGLALALAIGNSDDPDSSLRWEPHVADAMKRLSVALGQPRDAAGAGPSDPVRAKPQPVATDFEAFAWAVLKDWPDMGELDPGTLQDLAVEHGLLIGETRTTPCHPEVCFCGEYQGHGESVTCYRRAAEPTEEATE